MKNAAVQLCLLMIAITSVHAVKIMQTSSLEVRVFPVDGAENVWAIRGTDSIKLKGSDGDFYLRLDPGQWKLAIDAKQPLKNVVLDNLEIKKGTATDLGRINLKTK